MLEMKAGCPADSHHFTALSGFVKKKMAVPASRKCGAGDITYVEPPPKFSGQPNHLMVG
jgi:hypothetical protein